MLILREARLEDLDAILSLSVHLKYEESSKSDAYSRLKALLDSNEP
ncbi:hypothetical protein HC752_04070 [Vibrio sp. S9_S30]|nr:hypothetical protein [Vibrio sp. S9_S30]MBD1556104.1 hypothetical protein [Vibrio sp. S9_S30]